MKFDNYQCEGQITIFDLIPDQSSSVGKMSQVRSLAQGVQTSNVSLKSLPKSKTKQPMFLSLRTEDGEIRGNWLEMDTASHGESWTANILAFPKDESVYFSSAPSPIIPSKLSEILEWEAVPEKYYLSARACEGILRRAEKRGKKLPDLLRKALEQQIARLTMREETETALQPAQSWGGHESTISDYTAVVVESMAFEGNGNRPSHHGDGYALPGQPMYTLNTTEVHGVVTRGGIAWDGKETMPTLTAHSNNQLMPDKGNLGAVIVPRGGYQPTYAMTDETFFGVEEDKTPTLKARDYKAPMVVTVPMMGAIPNKPRMVSGVDLYNQTETGDVAKTMSAVSSDADHVPCVIEQFPMNSPEIEGGYGSHDDGHELVRHINGSEQHSQGSRCSRSDVCGCTLYQKVIGSLCAEDRKGVQNQTIDQDKLIVMRINHE